MIRLYSWSHGRSHLQFSRRARQVQQYSTKPPASRIASVESRLPVFLRKYIAPLRNAPVSHITSFMILHEITAVVPLFAFAAAFHYSNWLPPQVAEWTWVKQGMEKWGRYAKKKGWVNDEDKAEEGLEDGAKVVLELATAWALTKGLLPVRLIGSVWATPWFARVLVQPVSGIFRKTMQRSGGKVARQSPGASNSPAAAKTDATTRSNAKSNT